MARGATQEEAARQLEAERQEELERDLLELRWLVKSLRTDLLLRDLHHKYDPTQPRVPAGNPQGGQWTSVTGSVGDAAAAADGSGDDSAGTDGDAGDAAQSDASGADTAPFSPDRRGWHDYTAGPNLVCGADLSCSREEIADQLARFSVPGRDPSKPVVDLERSFIVDPRTGAPVGWVDTDVENNGLRIVNRTTILHALYDGKVVRSATQDEDGLARDDAGFRE